MYVMVDFRASYTQWHIIRCTIFYGVVTEQENGHHFSGFFSSSHIFESAHISHHNMFLYCRDSSEEDCTDKTECPQLVYEQVHFHFSLLSELKSLSLSFSLSLMISLCCDRLFLLLCSKTRTVQILVATYIHVSLLSMQIWLICRYDQVTIRTNFTFRPVPIYFQNIP